MESLISVVQNNFWGTVFVLVLVPLVTNVYAGLRRRALNRFRDYPTYAPGAVYRHCVSPAGWIYPELLCVRNGIFSVVMQTQDGGIFRIENRILSDWVLPIVYDPMRPQARMIPSPLPDPTWRGKEVDDDIKVGGTD